MEEGSYRMKREKREGCALGIMARLDVQRRGRGNGLYARAVLRAVLYSGKKCGQEGKAPLRGVLSVMRIADLMDVNVDYQETRERLISFYV